MRLYVSIPQVEPTVMDAPDVCPYPDCDRRCFKGHQQRCNRPLRDTKYSQVNTLRRECLHCGRTCQVYPKGAGIKTQGGPCFLSPCPPVALHPRP